MPKLRILHVDTASSMGGGQRIMRTLVMGLRTFADVSVCIPNGHFFSLYQQMVDVETHELPAQEHIVRQIISLRRICKTHAFDILHCHGLRSAFVSRLALLGLRNASKVVYTVHGFHIAHKKKTVFVRLQLLLEKVLAKKTSAIVAVSVDDATLLKQYDIPEERIHVIPNGIDVPNIQATSNTHHSIFSVGRLDAPKDVETVIQAMEHVHAQLPQVVLYVIGNGPQKEQLQALVQERSLDERVQFLGQRDDVQQLLETADALVCSSAWEGQPLVVLEAMAAHVPVIGSDVHGIRSLIEHNRTGTLFSFGDAEELASSIVSLYDDRAMVRAMADTAYTYVKNNHTADAMVAAYNTLYEDITSK